MNALLRLTRRSLFLAPVLVLAFAPVSTALATGDTAPVQADPKVQAADAVQEAQVVVDRGYQPGRIPLTARKRVRLTFLRKDYGPCTREVVFPSLGIRRELPTGTPVVIELPELPPGEVEFHCGMSMSRGKLVVTEPGATGT